MFARFFIDRPIFAAVLSIAITLAGLIAVFGLPIAMFPPVTPPLVQVDCRYPGASAKVVAETIAAPIEQQVNGVEGMMYMSSQSTNDGGYNLAVTFRPGVNLNMAQVLVQNRVSQAIPLLPEVIKQAGVTIRKRSPDILLSVNLNSSEPQHDQLYLSNYALTRLREELARLPGVSDVSITGQRDYSMRIWLDPPKLKSRQLTASDVVAAIREQNMVIATGQVGQPPIPQGQILQVPLSTMSRIRTPEQFEEIVIKRSADGRLVLLKDVARVTLGSKSEDVTARLDGRSSVGMPIFQLPDANALDVADAVLEKMKELEKDFPPGMRWQVAYDTTPFIRESIKEVFKALRDAILMVAIVVILFLQSWRSAIIPLAAVPVAIIGTFAAMEMVGFSLNNLTLFGLVLAIGIVVDDAIVVVEAVEHHIEHGLSPRDATIQAMKEVSGPVLAVGLVLASVFLPCAFLTGITGSFFRQFALTIAVSTIISTFNSLTLSPALAAILLKPKSHGKATVIPWPVIGIIGGWLGYQHFPDHLRGWLQPFLSLLSEPLLEQLPTYLPWLGALLGAIIFVTISYPINWLLRGFFSVFNATFKLATNGYLRVIRGLLRVSILVLLVYFGLLGLTYWGFKQLPTGFIPSQDMGYLMVNVQLPDAASTERTQASMQKMERIALETRGVKHVVTVTGQSLLLSAFGSNYGSQFILLDDYDKRRDPSMHSEVIANELRRRFAIEIPEAQPAVFGPPPLRGIGRAGGFKLMVEDRSDIGLIPLQDAGDDLVLQGNQTRSLVGLFNIFRANSPQLFVDVNRKECRMLGVPLRSVFDTLQIYLGSLYVNDFNMLGRTWQVIVQAESGFRNEIEDVKRLQVRNSNGMMVPLGTLATVKENNGPLIITRYNMYPAAGLNGNAAPGVSSGTAIKLMEQLSDKILPAGMKYEWTELAYLELEAGNTTLFVFGIAVAMVFLVLAAQYESWSLPLAVILVVPMCLLSAITGVYLAKHDINIITQVGFVVLVGLASKNAILIVEFAKKQREAGMTAREAALEACKLRLRPIIMTSVAFILGALPMVLASGAGAEMRRMLGTAVFSGMIGVTFFGILLTPIFFVLVDQTGNWASWRFPWLRRIADSLLWVLSFKFVRSFVHMVDRARKKSHSPRNTPPSA